MNPIGINRRRVLATLLCVSGAMLSPAAFTQSYPSKPIRLIVPFTVGGVTDSGARIVAEQLSRRLGQQVIVDNRPGASGNIGTQMAAKAEPDGYTLLLSFDGTMVINPHVYDKIPFDTLGDFMPVGKVGDAALILVAHPSVKARNWGDLVNESRAAKGGISYGTAGIASTPHIAGELLRQKTGVNLIHVPYKGGGQAMGDVIGGNIPLVYTAVASVYSHLKAGRVIPIAVSSASRLASLPDVPTLIESGVSDFQMNSWIGVFAPIKTPREVVDRLNREINATLADAETRAKLDTLGITTTPGTPEKFKEEIKTDLRRFHDVIKAAGIKFN